MTLRLALLLDPALICDNVQRAPLERACPADVLPEWGPIPRAAFVSSGLTWTRAVPAPPLRALSPYGPCQLSLTEARGYSTWLEGVCRVLAEAMKASRSRPVAIHCDGIKGALGPAAAWLAEAGFVVQPSRISSP